jgi:putative transposase
MTKLQSTDLSEMCNRVATETGDALRHILQATLEDLMSAEADGRCGAPGRARSPERTNSRNGYRERPWDTRMGTMNLQIPKLRKGTYFPDWLLEPRRRAEQALYQVVAECYLLGVSTRRVDDLVKTLGIDGIDKSQVSVMSRNLDERVREFRERPLDPAGYPYVWVDALYIKVREGGRIVSVATAVATAVNAAGKREIIGLDTFTTEDGASWTSFFRGLVARGLKNTQLIVSDAHVGLKAAIAAVMPDCAWQRCRTHAMKNLLSYVPKHAQEMVATLVRSVFAQPDTEAVRQQFDRVVGQLRTTRFGKSADFLEACKEDLLAFGAFPKTHWRQLWSNNPQERLNREIRRRTDVVGIFPHRESLLRLVGAVLAEQHDEWQVSRCYMTFEKQLNLDDHGGLDSLTLTSHTQQD